MGGFGWINPLPFEIGGGQSDTERIYLALRKAVGDGGSGPADGLEDLWRQCKAQQIAASLTAAERAALQALPDHATDHLDVYEELLAVPRAPTEAERQEAVALAFTLALGADIPTIRAELAKLSPLLDVEAVSYNQATTTGCGKTLGPRTGGPVYGSGPWAARTATGWPNYADDFVLHVLYTSPANAPIPPAVLLGQLGRYLNDVLPCWVDFTVYNQHGFYLDGGPDGHSLLDLTAFS